MAWVLGGGTLPTPHEFKRAQIELSAAHESITGIMSKDIKNRKERFMLAFRFLTQSEVTSILAIYNTLTVVAFYVSDGSLSISSTDVHMVLNERFYNTPGSEYREDFEI